MGLLTDPHVLVEIYLAKYPASLGTTTLRLTEAKRPVSFAGAFYQPRIKDVDEVVRSCTDPDGNYEVGGLTLTIADPDGSLGLLLDQGEPEEYWLNRELALWLLSYEGKLAGLAPSNTKPFFRGWVKDAQRNGRNVILQVGDVLGSQMSGFNLDKRVLTLAYKDATDCARDETKDLKFRIAVGEFSDRGAKDAAGVTYPNGIKGLWPLREVCEIDITTLETCPDPVLIAPPIITASGVVGTSGEKPFSYAATTITLYGESGMSNIVTISGASTRNASNFNWLKGTFVENAVSPFNKVRILRSESADPASFHQFLDEADYFAPTNNFCYGDGGKVIDATVVPPAATRDELDILKEWVPTGASASNVHMWSIMEICLGYGYDVLDIFASDLADGKPPRRKLVTAAEHGVTFITSADPQWPFPNPWIELNGIRFTGILARGPKLNHHRDGSVTMAVNFCGPHGANGNVINQAFSALQFTLNEHCLKNKGTGYRNQTYGTLETYNNGDALLQTSTFAACQSTTALLMETTLGYLASIWVTDESTTWRDVVGNFCRTFGARLAPNRFGQIKAIVVDTTARTVAGRHFRERIEIKRTEDALMAYDQIVNQYVASWFWDPDAGQYRGQKVVTPNPDSIAAHVPGGVSGTLDKRGLRELEVERPYTADEATAVDVTQRELLRRQRRPRYPVITVPLLGVEHDLGEEGRLTDSHGLGLYGDVATPVMIQRHASRLSDREVTLTFQDLRSVTSGTSTSVGDESGTPTAVTVNDEASVPPTAVEVG